MILGYFQCKIHEDDKHLFTFLLPGGNYQYNSTPMGVLPSCDHFNIMTDEAFRGTEVLKEVDDVLSQAKSVMELVAAVKVMLDRCREYNIKLSKSKMEFGERVKFAGIIISAEGCFADPSKIAALRSTKVPENITELRSYIGTIKQLEQF